MRVGEAWGIGEGVGDSPVDEGAAGGDGAAEVGDLEGRGFVGEDAEA